MKFNQRARMLRRNGETKSCDPVNRSKHLHTFSWRGRDAVHLWSLINDALQSIWDYEHSMIQYMRDAAGEKVLIGEVLNNISFTPLCFLHD